MNQDTQKVLTTLEAGEVLRYHAAPSVTPETIAQHSWGVAVITLSLMGLPFYSHEVRPLTIEALGHDTGEYHTGDIPATFKWACPRVKTECEQEEQSFRNSKTVLPVQTLDSREHLFIHKAADMLEGMWWTRNHERPGGPVFARWEKAIADYINQRSDEIVDTEQLENLPLGRAMALFEALGGRHSLIEHASEKAFMEPFIRAQRAGRPVPQGYSGEEPGSGYVNQDPS